MRNIILTLAILTAHLCYSQLLPPKPPSLLNVKQIHSGHSLTDPLFANWPGQYVNLIGNINSLPSWQLFDVMVGKSTTPGSAIRARWENPPGFGSPDARFQIAKWELLSITERVPLLYEGGSTQQWYLDGMEEQKKYLSLFANNAWETGNNGNGAPTLLWTTWVNIDGSDGNFRQMLDTQGAEWERMQDFANLNRPSGAPHIYMIPGHKMMARLYDDIQLGIVPGITNINQLFSDNIHTNELGSYAVSLIHYACIFNKSPLGLTNNLLPDAPAGTPTPTTALATYLQNMIWEIVTNYNRTGVTSNVLNSTSNTPDNIDFILYPNPANDYLLLKGINKDSKQKVTIFNTNGQMLYSGNENKITITHLPSGSYILKIGDTHKIFHKL